MRLPRNRASALPCDPPQTLANIKNRHATAKRNTQKLEPIDEAAGKEKTTRFSRRKIRTLIEDVSRASIYSVGSSRASFGTSMLELLKGLDDIQFLSESTSSSRRRSSLFASMLGSGNESSLMHSMSTSLEGSNLQKSEASLSGSDRKGLYNGGVRYFTPYAQDSDSEDETTECTEEDEYETKEENAHDEESEIEESERSDLDLDSSLGSTVSEEEEVYYYTQSGERVSRSTMLRNKAMEGRDQPKKKVLQRMKKSFLASLKV
ncbi:hypothetical protein ACHAXT_000743 [Thalassiosira profunda]